MTTHHVPVPTPSSRSRLASCGGAVCYPGYDADGEGPHNYSDDLPYGNGTSRIDYVDCPGCLALIVGLSRDREVQS